MLIAIAAPQRPSPVGANTGGWLLTINITSSETESGGSFASMLALARSLGRRNAYSTLAHFNLFNPPARVFGDQRFRIARGAAECGQSGRVADIPQRDADVAKEAATFRSHDRRAGKSFFESGIVEREQFQKIRLFEVGSPVGLHELSGLGKAIPRADGQAIVAAENPIADSGPELDRD